jgi:hypothetical protein
LKTHFSLHQKFLTQAAFRMNWRTPLLSPWAKPFVWFVLTLPAVWLIYAAFNDLLGANPARP